MRYIQTYEVINAKQVANFELEVTYLCHFTRFAARLTHLIPQFKVVLIIDEKRWQINEIYLKDRF